MDFTFFEIISEIHSIETIAIGSSIKTVQQLNKQFGKARWRKLKGAASVRLESGRIRKVELHWYEANGVGKKKIKIKRFLD